MSDGLPCNPLHKTNLGASVADALLGRKPRKLHGLKRFDGAGIYALYYQGMYAPYRRLAALNQGDDPQAPIYIGKAIPEGGRKGGGATDSGLTRALHKRLKEHAESLIVADVSVQRDDSTPFAVTPPGAHGPGPASKQEFHLDWGRARYQPIDNLGR